MSQNGMMEKKAAHPRIQRRGLMLVMSAPSGGGKTTITRRLLALDSHVTISISATTRDKRPGEVDGQHYFFVTREKFKEMVQNGEFLEHAEIYGQFYGTPKAPVEAALAAEKDVLFDIDWQGMLSLRQTMPGDVASIFIVPPDKKELEKRLRGRGQDSEENMARRLDKVAEEVTHSLEYDYIIINRDIDKSVARTRAILEAERMKRHRLPGLPSFISEFKA